MSFLKDGHFVCRLEKVELGCIYSKAKIAGTLLCVAGAVIMSLTQSTLGSHKAREAHLSVPPTLLRNLFDERKIMGCFYLMAAVFVLSSTIILQVIECSPVVEEIEETMHFF